ncbi:MAG TPA: Hsp70 family protein [Anaerolineae bacterium]|nr:Hsp70 family protein [Anaerolineae bacterium]
MGDAKRFGIDFGTTNSAIAFYDGHELQRPTVDPGSSNPLVLPSLLYIDRQQQSLAGTAAAQRYLQNETGRRATWEKRRVGEIDVVASGVSYVQTVHALVDTGAQGRLLQYIKTALRDPGYDGTQVFDRFYTVDELIALILRPLKISAEQQLNRECQNVVMGRPVKFSADPAVSDRAQEILYKAARLAGFADILFEMEPIGALYFYHRLSPRRELALIFDFGGGTLDLTLAEVGGMTPPHIIATLGVLVGGDDLDRRLMQYLLKYFGGMPRPGRRALPPDVLDLLENWQTMPLLSRPHFLKILNEYRADNPNAIDALLTLVTRNLGFQLFREIERTKIRLSDASHTELEFNYATINIRETLTRYKFEDLIAPEIEAVDSGVRQILHEAAIDPDRVDVILRTGGTSAVPAFTDLLADIFDRSKIRSLELLTSVVGGLAIAAHEDRGQAPAYEAIYPRDLRAAVTAIRSDARQDYELYEFRIGAPCYLDFSYSVNRIPVALSALPAIRTAQADKAAETEDFLHFQLARPATIYIAYDADAASVPHWLDSYMREPWSVEIDQLGTPRLFKVYSRECAAGDVSLGGNRAAGSAGNIFMNYFVVIRPAAVSR